MLSGHLNLGPITIYGRNAMHWAANIKTKRWGYICFRLPLFCFGKFWPLYFYVSPNATPWASTFSIGRGDYSSRDAAARRKAFGHNFSVAKHHNSLFRLNDELSFRRA